MSMESLTTSEYQIMELLWDSDTPMTSVELAKHADEQGWKKSYIFILIRSLQKKHMIEPCGTVQYGTQYARQFRPSVTREMYAARLAVGLVPDRHSIPKVAVAMAQETTADKEEVIRELEDIIREFKEELQRQG